jgi:tRNA threonylcarbamoyl adenosine modification protein YjeE
MAATETFTTDSVEATRRLGAELARRWDRGDCVSLVGDLGAGKTAFTRGVAEGLRIADPRAVSSPTYVLVHEYDTSPTLFHLDLYRLGDPQAELEDLGLAEMLAEGVVLIEWADRAEPVLPTPRWDLRIAIVGPDRREFSLRRLG